MKAAAAPVTMQQLAEAATAVLAIQQGRACAWPRVAPKPAAR